MSKKLVTSAVLNSRGVLVGSNKALEWLLPWWWERYSACNTLPVAFADFGLSDSARRFCEERGQLISLDEVSHIRFTSPNQQWAASYGVNYQAAREGWFRKPLALIKSPFVTTLWCDLDCEILKSIEPIFSLDKEDPYIAIARELSDGDSPYPVYNGGVILYRKESMLIQAFAEQALCNASNYWGDDRLLSHLIDVLRFRVQLLSPLCNWRINQGVPVDPFIIHWVGQWGKKYIRMYGGLKSQFEKKS